MWLLGIALNEGRAVSAPWIKSLTEKCLSVEFNSPIIKMMHDTLNSKIKYVYLASSFSGHMINSACPPWKALPIF